MNISNPMSVIAPVALLIPLLVTFVVCLVARSERTPLPAAALVRVAVATIAAVVLSRFIVHPGFILGTTIGLFCLFAVPVTRAMERTVTSRLQDDPVRSATLIPRAVHSYVSLLARTAILVAGAGLLSWIGARVLATHLSMLTITFTFAAVTFYFLYEVWIRQEVFSVRAGSDTDRRRRVRAILFAQTIFMLSFLLIAGLSAGKWPGQVPLAVFAAIVGAIGCAFPLSTGIQERYLRAWSARG